MNNIKSQKQKIISLLEKILKHAILDIKIKETEKYENLNEYNFSLCKIMVSYRDGSTDEIHLKMIKGGKIKESIFCYWSLLYEEYLKDNEKNNEDVIQKAIINQVTSNKNSSCILLTLNAKLNYCAEINLIELRKFCKNNPELERWLDSLDINDEDILFVGKKMY